MGGKPMMAIAILGWPINTLSAEVAQQVLEGSRSVCEKAGIPLAGGHSIDSPEPIFGLAVTGSVRKENLKRNDTAQAGAHLYLTKPLGIGIVTTAQKKGIVEANDLQKVVDTMLTLNSIGAEVGMMPGVCAMTDVTGFGLLGHLTEVCKGSDLSAEIEYSKVPKFDFLEKYIAQKSMPGGTQRNWDSYGKNISPITDAQKAVLADPQTSGGLLICVEPSGVTEFENWATAKGLGLQAFGQLTSPGEFHVVVKD
jgi:selenide,water dikinase